MFYVYTRMKNDGKTILSRTSQEQPFSDACDTMRRQVAAIQELGVSGVVEVCSGEHNGNDQYSRIIVTSMTVEG